MYGKWYQQEAHYHAGAFDQKRIDDISFYLKRSLMAGIPKGLNLISQIGYHQIIINYDRIAGVAHFLSGGHSY
jgi:hypothetical protein